MKHRLILSCLLLWTGANLAAQLSMTKLFHHHGTISDKLSCYFSAQPLCNPISDREVTVNGAAWRVISFMVPRASMDQEVRSLARSITDTAQDHYAIVVEQVAVPVPGVRISITYNPEHIGIEQGTYTAIQQQPGLIFTLFHKDVVRELDIKQQPVHYLALGKKKIRVVIDSGHGGIDEGKAGLFDLKEKDITLRIGMLVAKLLRKHGCVVSLTRVADRFVALDDRTTFANCIAQADLFVSIHVNGAPSPRASGIETFCSPGALITKNGSWHIEPAIANRIAEYEQGRSVASATFATLFHNQVLDAARRMSVSVSDRTVKQAVVQVLMATDMPAILVELGFISNEREAQLLGSTHYQDLLAQGICDGVTCYIQHLKERQA